MEEFDTNLPAELQSVEEKMKELMEIEQADKLQEEFDNFKKSCDNIMQKKKNLIIEFTKELDYRDQTYVDSMKQFHKDIKKMIKLMSEQFITLRDKMLTELNLIEEKFNEDRKDILDKQYSNYIKSLLDKLDFVGTEKEKELTNLQDTLEENAEMEAKKKEDDFIYRVIHMENHLNYIKEKVEDFLYDIKILYEKLEYRIKIRDEKLKEADDKKEQFSAMEMNLKDKITRGLNKYKQKDQEKREKNSKLRNDLLKMTHSYDALKEKFQHFEKHDELRFKEIYDMKNKENIQKILHEKEELLIDLFFQYEEIEKNYTEDDKFVRENLFEFYKKKYKNCSYFSFSKMKFLMDTMNDIQAQLRKKFFQYCDKYCQIRNNFFEINNYIIKIKKLFNI